MPINKKVKKKNQIFKYHISSLKLLIKIVPLRQANYLSNQLIKNLLIYQEIKEENQKIYKYDW